MAAKFILEDHINVVNWVMSKFFRFLNFLKDSQKGETLLLVNS